MFHRILILFLLLIFQAGAFGQQSSLDAMIDEEIEPLLSIYKKLHAAPELSHHEKETSTFVAGTLRTAGYDVTEGVGRYDRPDRTCHGLVAVLKNGEGPTVMVRTDLDALPLEEQTGLPYASEVLALNDAGEQVPAMHACGHDMHMTVFLGTARMLMKLKDRWRGTVLLVGQPAEETGSGSRALLEDGLFERFPRPDFALALHLDPYLEAGRIGPVEGYAFASVHSVDILVRGKGGHGAAPDTAIDPVVTASQIVLALQTIVSRELPPLDSAVVTVGSIHGGTKHNIIPDEVRLQLTIRTYKQEVWQQVIDSIRRITSGIALAAGVPEDRMPVVEVDESQTTPALYNDPGLVKRLTSVWKEALGPERVVRSEPLMVGEDFARYSLEDHAIPICMLWLGSLDPKIAAQHRKEGTDPPALHSCFFTPLPEPTLRTGIKAVTSAALALLDKP
ncbi:MAG: amidohydrolase [Planctomycetota bacterium]